MIKIKKLVKTYKQGKGKEITILKNISLEFPNSGLVSIVGRSGCGKSTLLHLLAGIDKSKQGEILYKDKNIFKFSKSRLCRYRNNDVGIVFQNYKLIEDYTALENIVLPGYVKGGKKDNILARAKKLLKLVNIPEEIYSKKVNELSGGEKQRIAICRALINNPNIILADEPTGALDYANSLQIMDILREISSERLVILVSHNKELVSNYSDRIIEIKDGKIVDNQLLHIPLKKGNFEKIFLEDLPKKNSPINWVDKIAFSNLRKHKFKNVISFSSITISIFLVLSITGFAFGSISASKESSLSQLDYGVLQASYEYKNNIPGSNLSLIKSVRPKFEDLEENISNYKYLEIGYNQAYFYPYYPEIINDNINYLDIMFTPIFSFSSKSVDSKMLIKGRLPDNDNFQEVVINELCYKKLLKGNKLLNDNKIQLNYVIETNHSTGDNENPFIKDYFKFNNFFEIVGVVKDFEFLSSPKIYYSYQASIDYLQNYNAELISNYFGYDISWFDYMGMVDEDSIITSYSLLIFIPYFQDHKIIREITKLKIENISFSSQALMREEAFLQLINASTLGISFFLIIAIIGTILLIGIISFSSYSKDKNKIAILEAFGTKKLSILNIYLSENLFIGLLGMIVGFSLAFLLQNPLSKLLLSFLGVDNMIQIPFANPILLMIVILSTIFAVFISIATPILFNNKFSLKEELKEE